MIKDGDTIHLGNKFTIETEHENDGYSLYCNGKFVFFNTNIDIVLNRYTKQVLAPTDYA